MVEDRTRADVTNRGVQPQTVRAGLETGVPARARYVRFTATKLAPRQGDFIFALAELMVLNSAGENLARGATVTALDSIEAPVRWQKKNLVDGYYVGAETNAAAGGTLADLQAQRAKLFERVVPPELDRQIRANELGVKETQIKLASLPKPQMVYAATHDFPANGSFNPAWPKAWNSLSRKI